ncbi:VOC family protein [Solwaraspora sp. WMMD406]|uniref:VOC family protein n=1 Tax=Solwaraspora sp. WMMD406 TaxID=3016095 RepID=UPI0024173693|nr:VOC family protein [Solwaraspora sp. WMMD406]MDG4764801.1 VOC family protein [Solwaraspora sp. WMMD406]
MANGRRPVSTVRKLVAAVLGTLATFVILFGAGMTSWAIAALGVALLVLAISLVLITAFPGAERAWVAGIAHVRSVSEPPASSAYGRCELQILVDAPGVPPRSVKIRDPRVPVAKWPDPGATLPIMVAIDDQRHVRIMWDDVLTHAEAAAQRAELPPEFDEPDFGPLDDDLLVDDDLLGVDTEPPWARRGADDDLLLDPDTVRTADLSDELSGLRASAAPDSDQPEPGTPDGASRDRATTGSPSGPVPRGTGRGPAENPRPDFADADFDADFAKDFTAPDRSDLDPPPTRDRDTGPRGEPVVVSQTPGGPIVLEGTLVDPPAVPLPRRPRPKPHPSDDPQTSGTGMTPPGERTHSSEMRPETGPAATGTVLADQPDTSGEEAATADLAQPLEDLAAAGPVQAGASTPAGDAGRFHGVGLTLLVADLDRSVEFYRDMLGFFEIDGGDGNAVLASGQTRLVLRSVPEVAPVNRRLMHINLEVDDLLRVHDELKSKGVRFTYAPRAVNRGARLELWAAAFRDPDGHGVAIIEWRDRDQPPSASTTAED